VINRQEQEMQEKNIPEKTSFRLFFGSGKWAEKNTGAAAAEEAKRAPCNGLKTPRRKQRGWRALLPVQGC
jgi:hypothetical protein